jgi:glucose/mannose-6-phosphate isomerase
MKKIILDFPKQFRLGIESAKDIEISGKFDKILILGMGGSALAGEVLKIFLKEKGEKIQVLIQRNYNLPTGIDKKTLISAISYSGQTEETISAFKKALKKKYKIFAITSGGKLLKICQKFNVPVVKIEGGIPPRMAIGILFSCLIKILINSKLIKDFSKEILVLEKKLNPETLEKEGKKLAKKLKGKILLIYSPEELEGLARIWKLNLNETAKVPAFFNLFPELNHGEIQSFEDFGKLFEAIFFFDPKSEKRILKREKITAEILEKRRVGIDFIYFKEKNILEKIFSKILLGFWLSFYLAILNKKDPLATKVIEELKERMKK